MSSKNKYTQKTTGEIKTVPFESVEEAWFWFIAAQNARNDGARFVSGAGSIPRPCEPLDILKVLDRLHRNRRLIRDHLLVLRHYGRRHMAPDPRRVKEVRAYTIWSEAMERIEEVLERKGIVQRAHWVPRENWAEDAFVLDDAMGTIRAAHITDEYQHGVAAE